MEIPNKVNATVHLLFPLDLTEKASRTAYENAKNHLKVNRDEYVDYYGQASLPKKVFAVGVDCVIPFEGKTLEELSNILIGLHYGEKIEGVAISQEITNYVRNNILKFCRQGESSGDGTGLLSHKWYGVCVIESWDEGYGDANEFVSRNKKELMELLLKPWYKSSDLDSEKANVVDRNQKDSESTYSYSKNLFCNFTIRSGLIVVAGKNEPRSSQAEIPVLNYADPFFKAYYEFALIKGPQSDQSVSSPLSLKLRERSLLPSFHIHFWIPSNEEKTREMKGGEGRKDTDAKHQYGKYVNQYLDAFVILRCLWAKATDVTAALNFDFFSGNHEEPSVIFERTKVLHEYLNNARLEYQLAKGSHIYRQLFSDGLEVFGINDTVEHISKIESLVSARASHKLGELASYFQVVGTIFGIFVLLLTFVLVLHDVAQSVIYSVLITAAAVSISLVWGRLWHRSAG